MYGELVYDMFIVGNSLDTVLPLLYIILIIIVRTYIVDISVFISKSLFDIVLN